MVMPMSRYLAGDFITPAMAFCWKHGVPYHLAGPDGVRVLPPDQPFGGPDAAEKRRALIPGVVNTLGPMFGGDLPWDEASDAEPRFERVDAPSFDAFQDHARALVTGSRFWRWLGRSSKVDVQASHLLGTMFVPAELDAAVDVEVLMPGIMTSMFECLRQLQRPCPRAAALARESMRSALSAGRELTLPVFLDA